MGVRTGSHGYQILFGARFAFMPMDIAFQGYWIASGVCRNLGGGISATSQKVMFGCQHILNIVYHKVCR